MFDDEKELPPPGHPLNALATRLAELLDEDHWAECEALLLKACAASAKERAPHWRDVAEELRSAVLETQTNLKFHKKPVVIEAFQTNEDELLDLLALMFDAYEAGPDCYEDPDECAGHIGKAVHLDDATFDRIADVLNQRRPRL